VRARMNDKHKIRAFVFDFDGTLAELRLDFDWMKLKLGLLAGEFLPEVELPPLRVLEWLEELRQEVSRREPQRLSEFLGRADRLIQDMEIDAARRGSLFPFTRPMLEGLQLQGIKAAVITRNCEEAVRLVFPDVDRYCGGLLARDHVPKVKPDPDHLLRALEVLACGVEGVVMVGDHPLDVETGKRAGVLTAGVSSGRIALEELARSGADWVAADCRDLMEQLGVNMHGGEVCS
jgi:phosphoglycolate phosphatase